MVKTRKSDIGWHVFRFHERFELADDQRFCRKGPLIYSRDYVSAADDESATYLQQLDALSRRQNGLELEGAWSRIRRAASSRSRAYRGWLLTATNCPMSAADIGRTVLFCDPRRATRILKTLVEVGLVEQARCPTFDLSQNEAPTVKRRTKATKGNEKAKRGKPKSGGENTVSHKNSENLEDSRSPLRAKKQNGKVSQQKRDTGIPEKVREAATPQGAMKPRTTTSPTTTPGPKPVDPKEPEGGQASKPENSRRPAPSAKPRPAAVPIGHCVKLHDYQADQFGLKVFGILGLDKRHEAGSTEGKSEWKSFASWLTKSKACAPPTAWGDLEERGLRKARHIAKYGHTAKSPGAVWHKVMGKPGSVAQAKAG